MGILSHNIERNKLIPGDHIYTWRCSYLYSHHGIYVDDEKVIHFTPSLSDVTDGTSIIVFSSSAAGYPCPKCGDQTRKSGVISSCLDCFLNGGQLYKYQYSESPVALPIKVRGGCTTASTDPPNDVIHRAKFLLKNDVYGAYDLKKNNCEDFALYCKTQVIAHKSSSCPGRSSQVKCVNALASAAQKAKSSPISACGFGINFCKYIYKNDIGVRSDVEKVAVEDLARHYARSRSWWRLVWAPAFTRILKMSKYEMVLTMLLMFIAGSVLLMLFVVWLIIN